MIIDPLHHHDVQLHRTEAGTNRRSDSFEHSLEIDTQAAEPRERLGIQGVQAHRDPPETRPPQSLGFLGQEISIGGERQIFQALERRQGLDETLDLGPEQGLASSQANLLDSQVDKQPRHPRDLFEAQDLRLGEERVLTVPPACRTCSGNCTDP